MHQVDPRRLSDPEKATSHDFQTKLLVFELLVFFLTDQGVRFRMPQIRVCSIHKKKTSTKTIDFDVLRIWTDSLCRLIPTICVLSHAPKQIYDANHS